MTAQASELISAPISSTPQLLHAANLTITYGAERILHGLNLAIHEGEIQLLLGGNGSGKSSLLRVLAGVQNPSGGAINRSLPLTSIGFVAHSPMLYGSLTVEQNLKLFSDLYASTRSSSPDNISSHASPKYLEEFWELKKLRNRLPHQLSRGQLARVAICRAMLNSPQLLILDEPGANLDDYWRGKLYTFLETEIREARIKSAIIASHDTSDLSKLTNQVLVLNNQRLELHTTDVAAGIQYHLRTLR